MLLRDIDLTSCCGLMNLFMKEHMKLMVAQHVVATQAEIPILPTEEKRQIREKKMESVFLCTKIKCRMRGTEESQGGNCDKTE